MAFGYFLCFGITKFLFLYALERVVGLYGRIECTVGLAMARRSSCAVMFFKRMVLPAVYLVGWFSISLACWTAWTYERVAFFDLTCVFSCCLRVWVRCIGVGRVCTERLLDVWVRLGWENCVGMTVG